MGAHGGTFTRAEERTSWTRQGRRGVATRSRHWRGGRERDRLAVHRTTQRQLYIYIFSFLSLPHRRRSRRTLTCSQFSLSISKFLKSRDYKEKLKKIYIYCCRKLKKKVIYARVYPAGPRPAHVPARATRRLLRPLFPTVHPRPHPRPSINIYIFLLPSSDLLVSPFVFPLITRTAAFNVYIYFFFFF